MVVDRNDLSFRDTLLMIKTCLMDVALVRGWCGMWDVYYAMYDVLCEVDEAVRFGGCGLVCRYDVYAHYAR